ncbi:hypothetical protein IB232_06705 [Pseudomonas sp. PDM15]|uniref:hypothetical protein n=1 Tax=Pseudomonas sp. PDM15 TaxID=2769303 RepID=UPI00178369B1|nr:hypothetical protein [Pseudomonas sp. PDM15]MBD9425003.1 hypothetical protein [Pseudomonas sp. PDM15]
MLCEHLRALEQALLHNGAEETFRGQAWSENCREWVYFDVRRDLSALQRRFALPACVQPHENADPHSGQERGLVCTQCHNAVMGLFTSDKVFR